VIVIAAAIMAVALAAPGRAGGLDDALLEKGRAAFDPCRSCHALDREATGIAGPNLAGLIGRTVGGWPDYDYSPVLRDAGDQGHRLGRDTPRLLSPIPKACFQGCGCPIPASLTKPNEERLSPSSFSTSNAG